MLQQFKVFLIIFFGGGGAVYHFFPSDMGPHIDIAIKFINFKLHNDTRAPRLESFFPKQNGY